MPVQELRNIIRQVLCLELGGSCGVVYFAFDRLSVGGCVVCLFMCAVCLFGMADCDFRVIVFRVSVFLFVVCCVYVLFWVVCAVYMLSCVLHMGKVLGVIQVDTCVGCLCVTAVRGVSCVTVRYGL
ncbi:Solute Carrier Family 46 Member 3 [Manis pentadactyla]|nr:Solute Carrier Family 46 Member 3 [Manis pentadactyla]